MKKIISAISIRQPYAELILRGIKKIEYRSVKTKKLNERIYIYASLTPGRNKDWKEMKLNPGDLPAGVIVGTVEIVGCVGVKGKYEWFLSKPVRLKKTIKPKGKPQPVFFKPFG